MIEAYAIGVNLSLRGNVGTELAAVARQFENLNKIIAQTKGAINELGSGMGAVRRQASAAAAEWKNAASQMRAAAREAQDAAAAMARMGSTSGAYGPASSASARSQPSNMLRINPPATPLLLTGPGGTSGRGGLVPYSAGTFAGGAGSPYTSGGLTVPPGGGGGGGIPLNLGPPLPRLPQMPNINQADAFVGAQGFGMLGDLLVGLTKKAFDANLEVDHALSALGRMGLSDEQLKEAKARSTELQRTIPGVTTLQGLGIAGHLMAVLQNTEEAIDPTLLKGFGQAGAVLNATGKTNALDELFKSMQAGELRGAFSGDNGKPDTAKAMAFLRNVITTTVQTEGRIGPSEILQVLKSSGLSGAMMADSSLFADSIAPAISLGPAIAGRGMQAFASQFVAGKMSDAAVKLMLRMKLIENLPAGAGNTAEQQFEFLKPHYKTGIGQWQLPMNMMPYHDHPELNPAVFPVEFIRKVLIPAMEAYTTKVEGKPPKDAQERMRRLMAEALALASRIPAGNYEGDVIRNLPLIDRDRAAIAGAIERNDNDGFYKQLLQTDPKIRMEALGAALNGLFLALGGPAMATAIQGIRDLTAAMDSISRFVEAHPNAAKNIMEYGFKLGLLSIGIGTFGTALAVIPSMVRLVGMSWGILTFGTALSGLPMSVLATLPGAMRAFGLAAIALRNSLLVGAGVAMYQGLKDTLAPGLDMHKWMLDHFPGAQWLNQQMNRATGGHVGDSKEDMERQYPGLNTPPAASPMARPPIKPDDPFFRGQPHSSLEQGNVTFLATITLDGQAIAKNIEGRLVRSGSGPSGGSTGFDARTVYSGGMATA